MFKKLLSIGNNSAAEGDAILASNPPVDGIGPSADAVDSSVQQAPQVLVQQGPL